MTSALALRAPHLLRGLAHIAAVTPVAVFSLACLVGGERASGGECPTGEVCSSATPSGVTFVSTGTFDLLDRRDGGVIDAVARGGHFEIGYLGLRDANDAPLAHTARVADGNGSPCATARVCSASARTARRSSTSTVTSS